MRRMTLAGRPDWRGLADRLGFLHHTPVFAPYWTDDACYRFDPVEVDALRTATTDLWDMCLAFVERACRDEEILHSLRLVPSSWDGVRASWLRRDPSLVTRFDFAHDGEGPPKLHECNGDTPGTLFEASVFQWIWFEDRLAGGQLPPGSDQFNRLHAALVEAFASTGGDGTLHATASAGNDEDRVWARYLADCARQAGRDVRFIDIEEIGIDAAGRFADDTAEPIRELVKAYRLELLLREPFGPFLLELDAPRLLEPLWKLVLSSKGALVWLWRMFPGHPNLLPCWFADDPAAPTDSCAVKPLFSIKGRNVTLLDASMPNGSVATAGPCGDEGFVVQALHRLPAFPGPAGAIHASVSTWIVAGRAEGLGVLEDDGPIINDLTCRFVPHAVAA